MGVKLILFLKNKNAATFWAAALADATLAPVTSLQG